ncbi:TPA: hypothetical protein JS257_002151 [Escherichia coli]|nr:hypothetical protein [Escherichia coli]
MSFLNKHKATSKDSAATLFKADKPASSEDLQRKPFSQWTKSDLAAWREANIDRCREDVEDGLLEEYELDDLINCWTFEIVGDALVRSRIAPPCEEMMLGLAKPTTDLIVGYYQVDGLDSLAAADTTDSMEQTSRQQRKVELQRRLHLERNIPGQELETIPRPAHLK